MNVNKTGFENIEVGTKETFDFYVTEENLKIFASLTGDYNSLHMNESFARRTRYRERIVHGMLPFSYISILKMFWLENYVASIVRIEAKFNSPIYLESDLIITAEVMDKDSSVRTLNVKITIEIKNSGIIATTGFVIVKFEEDGNKVVRLPSNYLDREVCLLTEPVKESKLILEEIDIGLTKSINFSISLEHIFEFKIMLEKGLENNSIKSELIINSLNIMTNVLSPNLFSTFVGMCIPGQNATFLDYKINFLKQIPLRKNLRLKGVVVQKSEATKIIKLELSILDQLTDDNYAIGNATVILNPSPTKMPNIIEIKQKSINFNLKNKVVLITGASRGIGETTAKLFALFGAKVIVNYYRGKEDAEKIVKEILECGGDAIALRADVSNLNEVEEIIRSVCNKYGKIDILVNNAVRDFLPKGFLKLTWEDIQKDIDVTVKGSFNCCKAVIPHMIKNGGGSIINVSTIATENPPPMHLKYVVSKIGLVGLTRSLAVEFASKNIRVNMVVPNFVETDLVASIPKVFQKKIANEIPLKRIANPIDVAQSIIFLASSFSSYITGQKIMVTGGSLPFL